MTATARRSVAVRHAGAEMFAFVHGSAPRGFGSWFFDVEWAGGRRDVFRFRGTFGESRAAAARFAREGARTGETFATVTVGT